MELRVLSRETGDGAYEAAADRIFDQLHEGWAEDGGGDMKRWTRGFYGKNCNFNNRLHARRGLGSGGDSFYEYLLKEQLVGDDSEARAAMYDWVESRLMRYDWALPNEHLALFAPGMLALGATASKRRRSASSTSRERALARARELVDGHGRDWYRTVWNQISDAPRHRCDVFPVTQPNSLVDFHTGIARRRASAPTGRVRKVDGMLCDRNMWRASSTSTGRPATKFTGTGAGPCSRRSSRIVA